MPPQETTYPLMTYRYLRIAMAGTLIMIAASVLIESARSWCLLGSVSSYYYTPVQTAFVGSLFAFGAALIVYQGHSTPEDDMLNVSGVLAFVVAIVPTVRDDSCQISGEAAPIPTQADAVTNNILAFVVAAVAALLLGRWLASKAAAARGPMPDEAAGDRSLNPAQKWIKKQWPWLRWVLWLVPALELGAFAWMPSMFLAFGHTISAVTMVAGLVLVMLFNAWFSEVRRADAGQKFRRRYQRLAEVLGVAVVVTAISASMWGKNLLILSLEFVILGIFVVYWLLQTVEMWGHAAEPAEAQADAGQH